MSRSRKIALCGSLALVSLACVGIVAYDMAAPRISRGFASAPPVTVLGWVQLAASILAAGGFTVAGVWQAVLAFIESRLPVVINQASTELKTVLSPSTAGANASSAGGANVDVAKLESFLSLIGRITNGDTKTALIEAARMACDNLRDDLFPLPTTGTVTTTVAAAKS